VYSARQSINPDEDLITQGDPLVSDLQHCVQIAAFRGYLDCLRIGLDAGFNYDSVELVEPAILGDQIAVLELLVDGNYVNINRETEHTSALGYAVLEEKVSVVEFLLTRGADPNIRVYAFVTKYQHSLSLISYAGFKNNVELMKVLLSHGLAVEDPEYHHRPIWWAVRHNNIEMARLFIEKGVDLSPSLHSDWPLHEAVRLGHAEMVMLMLEEGGMPEDASEIVELYYEIEVCGSTDVQRIFGRAE
jgi:ankyrin repeat protein